MRRSALVVVAAVVSAVLSMGAVTAPAEARKPKPPCCGATLTVAKVRTTPIDPAAPAVGQVRVAKGTLSTTSNLKPIGSYSSVQTILSIEANGTVEVLNTTVYKLAKGTITTSGTETWTPDLVGFDDPTPDLAITGGTGLYAGVSGSTTSTNTQTNYFVVQFTFANTR
jgi:hypothetical protein